MDSEGENNLQDFLTSGGRPLKTPTHLLAEADASGQVEAMRLAYHGRDPITAVFQAKDLFP